MSKFFVFFTFLALLASCDSPITESELDFRFYKPQDFIQSFSVYDAEGIKTKEYTFEYDEGVIFSISESYPENRVVFEMNDKIDENNYIFTNYDSDHSVSGPRNVKYKLELYDRYYNISPDYDEDMIMQRGFSQNGNVYMEVNYQDREFTRYRYTYFINSESQSVITDTRPEQIQSDGQVVISVDTMASGRVKYTDYPDNPFFYFTVPFSNDNRLPDLAISSSYRFPERIVHFVNSDFINREINFEYEVNENGLPIVMRFDCERVEMFNGFTEFLFGPDYEIRFVWEE
jgi:hypothetical protein